MIEKNHMTCRIIIYRKSIASLHVYFYTCSISTINVVHHWISIPPKRGAVRVT